MTISRIKDKLEVVNFRGREDRMQAILKKRIRVYGIVQGVGFRPTVDRLAHEAGIRGTVANCGPYVEIMAEGSGEQIDAFLLMLEKRAPERSVILKIDVKDMSEDKTVNQTVNQCLVTVASDDVSASDVSYTYSGFSIIESEHTSGEIFISPDIAICPICKKELFDPENRRYLHPFINCTSCGPRLTILESLPYDRERTSMKKFPMCPKCAEEYKNPQSRRYDAQPVCCNECGPEVYILDKDGNKGLTGGAAISFARGVIVDGGIVAVKGIGGFHLACDATNEVAVKRLRERKHRPSKPFAVMMKNEMVAERYCDMTAHQKEILRGHQKPIILLQKGYGYDLAGSVAPDNDRLGVMLPYAPIQLLLFDYPDEFGENGDMQNVDRHSAGAQSKGRMPEVLVMTSGNESGVPIAKDDADAMEQLGEIADCILTNSRDIRLRTDDTVMDFYDDEPYMIRRSRGYAPVPVMMSNRDTSKKRGQTSDAEVREVKNLSVEMQKEPGQAAHTVLAIGGEGKNTFCLASGNLYYPSSFIGDLADLRSIRVLEDSIARMEDLLKMKPEVVVCDLHPKYNSVRVAEKIARENELPLLRVQHHVAHVLSCMAENDVTSPVIGVSFDGTGYGSDGSIWGGEFLVVNQSWEENMDSTFTNFSRPASIMPFTQIGGDASAREGWRIATSMIIGLEEKGLLANLISENGSSADFDALTLIQKFGLADGKTAKVQKTLYQTGMNAVQSTSAGRLFDAVSALLGIRKESSFEGEASTTLMYRARLWLNEVGQDFANVRLEDQMKQFAQALSLAKYHNAKEQEKYGRKLLPTNILFAVILNDMMEYLDADEEEKKLVQGRNAYFFHLALAQLIAAEVGLIHEETGIEKIALTGGVFQNTLLLDLTEGYLEGRFEVLRHHLIPPNDGGIGLGQALTGMQYLK